jgi:hypothetical protein
VRLGHSSVSTSEKCAPSGAAGIVRKARPLIECGPLVRFRLCTNCGERTRRQPVCLPDGGACGWRRGCFSEYTDEFSEGSVDVLPRLIQVQL